MNPKTKKKATKKEERTFNKKAFLEAALPIVGMKNIKHTDIIISMVQEKSGFIICPENGLAQHVGEVVRKSDNLSELRAKLHTAIKELNKVMELTMQNNNHEHPRQTPQTIN